MVDELNTETKLTETISFIVDNVPDTETKLKLIKLVKDLDNEHKKVYNVISYKRQVIQFTCYFFIKKRWTTMQAKTLNLVMHEVESKTGITIPEAQSLNKTLKTLEKESTVNAEGLAEEVGVALDKAQQILDILEELGIIELIPLSTFHYGSIKMDVYKYKFKKASISTFHYGSIKIRKDIKCYCLILHLHSTMVLLK